MTFKEAQRFVMPFGNYKGKILDRIAMSDAGLRYLDWLLGDIKRESRDKQTVERLANSLGKDGLARRALLVDALKVYLTDAGIAGDLAKLVRAGKDRQR